MTSEYDDGLEKGVHRARSAAATCEDVLARLAAFDPPILDRYEEMHRPSGIPQFRVVGTRQFAAVVQTGGTNGKGHTWEQAMASGLMELVERYSCFSHLYGLQRSRRCAARDLQDNLYDPRDLLASFPEPPDALLDAEELAAAPFTWFEGRTLDGRAVLLPELANRFLSQGGNGMAAGSTPDEALIQGLCEVVERHCDTLIRLGRLHTPRIDPATIESPVLAGLIRRFESMGQVVHVQDFSLGTGLPVFGVLRVLDDGMVEITTGVAPWRDEALARTLTESSQGERGPRCVSAEEGAAFLDPDGTKAFTDMPSLEGGELRDEIDRFAKRFRRLGWRPFVIEATLPGLGLPAVVVDVVGAKYTYPKRVEVRTLLSSVVYDCLQSGDLEAAERYLVMGRERDPDGEVRYHYCAGRLLFERGDPKAAIDELQTVVDAYGAVDQREPRLLAVSSAYLIVRCHQELKDARRALEWYARVRELETIAADG